MKDLSSLCVSAHTCLCSVHPNILLSSSPSAIHQMRLPHRDEYHEQQQVLNFAEWIVPCAGFLKHMDCPSLKVVPWLATDHTSILKWRDLHSNVWARIKVSCHSHSTWIWPPSCEWISTLVSVRNKQ